MKTAGEFVRNMPADITLDNFCQQITTLFSQTISEANNKCSAIPPEQRPAASAAIYSQYYRQIWLIGDCQCMIDGVLYENNKPAEEANAAKRSLYIHQLFDKRKEVYTSESPLTQELQQHDTGRDHIIDDIIRSMQGANRTYAVIDGTLIYKEGIRVIDVAHAHELILATDGYPFLKPTLHESEEVLSSLLHTDPLCIEEYLATKGLMKGCHSFDDRTYIRFQI